MAAAGIKPASEASETLVQRQEREKREREERLKKAEEEDAKREEERQHRLASEQGISAAPSSPTAKSAKKPPPPPSRVRKQDSFGQNDIKSPELSHARAVAEREVEQDIKQEQVAQHAESERLQ